MKQTILIHCAMMFGLGLMAGLSGCATKSRADAGLRVEPRLLGAGAPALRPPPEAGNGPDGATLEEPLDALTLRQALALALARSPELAAFSWEVRMGEARALQAGLRPNPEVGVEVENAAGTGEFRGVSAAETTLQLSQLIELGGKRAARLKMATLARDLSGWDYEALRIDVLTGTAAAFVEVLSLQQRLALAEQSVRLAEKALDAVNRRVEAARTFAVERTKAQVALASVQIERDQAERALSAARQRLSAAWGETEPRFNQAEGDLERLVDVPNREQLLERLEQNPELARWTTEISRRRAALDWEKSRRVPDITVGGGYRRLNGPDAHAFLAGVSIPWPLFNRNQGKIQEAQYRLARARDEQRAAELRVTTELGQAWQRLAAARSEIAAIKESVLPGAQQTFDTVSQYYNEGRLSYLEVLDAQRIFFGARAQYYRALADYHQALVAIEGIIGEPLTAGTRQPQNRERESIP